MEDDSTEDPGLEGLDRGSRSFRLDFLLLEFKSTTTLGSFCRPQDCTGKDRLDRLHPQNRLPYIEPRHRHRVVSTSRLTDSVTQDGRPRGDVTRKCVGTRTQREGTFVSVLLCAYQIPTHKTSRLQELSVTMTLPRLGLLEKPETFPSRPPVAEGRSGKSKGQVSVRTTTSPSGSHRHSKTSGKETAKDHLLQGTVLRLLIVLLDERLVEGVHCWTHLDTISKRITSQTWFTHIQRQFIFQTKVTRIS